MDGKTGVLVDYDQDKDLFEDSLTAAIIRVMSDETLATNLGKAGRARAMAEFGWDKVAKQTIDLYRSLIK